MNSFRRFIKFLSGAEDLAVFLLSISLFLVGLYGLYDSYLVYRQANDDSILTFKPGYEGEQSDRKIEGNMVAWLTIDGTKIDYPVMQGETNNEYLNKSPYGEYSLSGSIFLDYRNSADFSDGYSLIYGHHMENGYMFGSLDQFMTETFFSEHQTGNLIAGDTEYTLTIFAAAYAYATDEYIFAPTTMDEETVLKHIKETASLYDQEVVNSLINDPISPDSAESDFCSSESSVKLLALSTCKYPDTIDRTVIFAFLSDC